MCERGEMECVSGMGVCGGEDVVYEERVRVWGGGGREGMCVWKGERECVLE